MPRLDIRLLGAPEIELNDAPIRVDTRKAIALLAYLAVSGEHHRRDSLATLLWPESEQARARAALRRTLSSLNAALNGEWLSITRETIGFRIDGECRLDIAEFQSRIDRARTAEQAALDDLTEALELYRGDFMSGFGLRDSPAFDDWQYFQAESLRRDLARALEQLTTHCMEANDWNAAIEHAKRWLDLDHLQEPAHRALMQLHALVGDRTSAIRQYRDCVQILDRELGVAPLEETTALYTAILEDQFPESSPSTPDPPDASTATFLPAMCPLVGRDAERASVIDTYQSISSAGRLIVIEGEAGIGKTRLAGELVARARESNAAVASGVCYAGESEIAYGVIAGMLRSIMDSVQADHIPCNLPDYMRGEVSRLIPEIGGFGSLPLPPMDSPGALDRFYDAIIQFLLALNEPDAPLLIFVDDLQWADDASLNVLSYLIRRLHRLPVCVLITWRSEEVPASHRMRQVLARSQRDGHAALIPLAPLTQRDVSTLVEMTCAKRTADLVQTLYQESAGVPFFAVEYLATIEAERSTDPDGWPIPDGVRALIRSRLDAVDGAGQQLLTTAAVIGRSFDFELLREASGRSESETIETLDHLMKRGLIRESSESGLAAVSYDFSHEKIRSLLYDETSLARRRLIHRRVAGSLERRSRRRGEAGGLAGQIAHHLRLAGMDLEAASYYRQAGDYARSLYGNAEALSHYRMALAIGHPESAVLHEAIGDLETLAGSYSDALQSYQTAAAHGDPAHLPLIEQKLGALHQRLGDWDIAERHYEAAFGALSESQAAERARVLAGWSLTAHQRGDGPRAVEIGRRALELAAESDDNLTLAQTYNLLGILARHQGNAAETARHLEQSLRFAKTMPEPGARIAALNNLALVCADQGEMDRAISLTEEALSLCRSVGDRHREAALLNNLADFCHMAADDEQAMAYLKQAVAIFAEIGQRTDTIHPEIWKLVEW